LCHFKLFCGKIVVKRTTCIWVGRYITDVSFSEMSIPKLETVFLFIMYAALISKTENYLPEAAEKTFLNLLG